MLRLTPVARAALALLLALQVTTVVYAGVSLAFEGVDFVTVWGAALALLAALTLQFERSLLRDLFSGQRVREESDRLRRFSILYRATISLGAAQLGFLLLVWALGEPLLGPGATPAFLIALGATLYASWRVYGAVARAVLAPFDRDLRFQLREWLLRSALATAVFAVINTHAALRLDAPLVPLGVYLLMAVLEVVALLVARAAARLRV